MQEVSRRAQIDATETETKPNDYDEMRNLFGDGVTTDEVFMALDVRERSTVGCAYYVAREEKLYLMQDCKFGDLTTIDTCNEVWFSSSWDNRLISF
jgi:hypothetical protein